VSKGLLINIGWAATVIYGIYFKSDAFLAAAIIIAVIDIARQP